MRISRPELPFLNTLFKPNIGVDDELRLPGELGETIVPSIDVLGSVRWNDLFFGTGSILVDAGPPVVHRWAVAISANPGERDGMVIMPYFSVEHNDAIANHTIWVGIRGFSTTNIPVSVAQNVPANTPVGITRPLILTKDHLPIGVSVDGLGANTLILRFGFMDLPVGEYVNMLSN